MSVINSLPRTEAQKTQDNNEGADGRVQINTSPESSVVPDPVALREEAVRRGKGLESLSAVSSEIQQSQAGVFVDQFTSLVKRNYPDAAKVTFKSDYGESLYFCSIQDAAGDPVECDNEAFTSHWAGLCEVDNQLLASSFLSYEMTDRACGYQYSLDVSQWQPRTVEQKISRADKYAEELTKIQALLEAQKAEASAAKAAHLISAVAPGAREFSFSEDSVGKPAVSRIRVGDRVYVNPRVDGEAEWEHGDIQWWKIDPAVDQGVDYSSLYGETVSVDQAVRWEPGESLRG